MIRLFIILFLFTGCGAQYHANRAAWHLQKAKLKGAKVSVDTVYKTVEVVRPEIRVDTVVQKVNFRDTIVFTKDRVVTKIKIDTAFKEVFVQTICPPDTVKVEVAVPCTQIKTGYGWWDMLILALACLLVGGLIWRFFIRK